MHSEVEPTSDVLTSERFELLPSGIYGIYDYRLDYSFVVLPFSPVVIVIVVSVFIVTEIFPFIRPNDKRQ